MKFKSKTKNLKNLDPFVIQEGKIPNSSLNVGKKSASWAEDSFISLNDDSELLGKTTDTKSLYTFVYLILLFALVLIARAFWLQIVKADYYYNMAEGNRIRIHSVEPRRGIIYDRNWKPLVRNVSNFVLYLMPIDLPKNTEDLHIFFDEISQIIGDPNLSSDSIFEKFAIVSPGSLEAYQPLLITDNIPYEKAMLLMLQVEHMPGVILASKSKREYLNDGALSISHLLGYTGKISSNEIRDFGPEYSLIDYVGKNGLESFYESELKGQKGKKHVEVDALGKEIKIISQIKPRDGKNLLLSIDYELQVEIENILHKHLDPIKLDRAAVIVMDPNNGELLSLVSLPAYDNNLFVSGIDQISYSKLIENQSRPLFNRAISGEYPSGSTIKPVIASAALQENIIDEHTSFLSTGGIRIGEWFFPDWKAGGHGITDLRGAIADSVNTFFYYIGGGFDDFRGLGVDRIYYYASLFGLGAQSGIDLMGEADGFLPTKEWKSEKKNEQWYIGDTYHLAIGQGDLLATPLQIANYTAVFANGGNLYRPHLVREILETNDKSASVSDTTPVREQVIDKKNIDIVRRAMRSTVVDGSGRRLSTLPVNSAGKTGTAQWSTVKDNHAWYTGFAPYENPEIAFTILVEEGKEGSAISVSIAYDILNYYFSRK